MYHAVVVGTREAAIDTACKLSGKLPGIKITIVQPWRGDEGVGRPPLNLPKEVVLTSEYVSSISVEGSCLQLENQDLIYFDFLVIDPGAVDAVNFAESM